MPGDKSILSPFSRNFSRSITSRTAMPCAHTTGFPPKILKGVRCANVAAIFGVVTTAPSLAKAALEARQKFVRKASPQDAPTSRISANSISRRSFDHFPPTLSSRTLDAITLKAATSWQVHLRSACDGRGSTPQVRNSLSSRQMNVFRQPFVSVLQCLRVIQVVARIVIEYLLGFTRSGHIVFHGGLIKVLLVVGELK